MALFQVDRVLTQQQAVVKDMGALLSHVPHCMGATINDDRCVLILDSASVIREWGRSSEWLLPPPSLAVPVEAAPGSTGADGPVAAARVAVFGDPEDETGLEGIPMFRVSRISLGDAVPLDADVVLVVVHGGAELSERIGTARAAAGPSRPVVVVASSGAVPSALATFDAGADDAWGDAHPPAERAQRLERILALYRHVGGPGIPGKVTP